ncbi:hypothetical protein [Chroococcidiopsis sp.]|uniref:hypothetical protein n=1 Tax=Chroococcidiopsis sp. TaxID=3088168 RepID=UPI003F3FDBC2
MSKLLIEIRLDNAAFEQLPGYEVARILEKYAAELRRDPSDLLSNFRDINGNSAGCAIVMEDKIS